MTTAAVVAVRVRIIVSNKTKNSFLISATRHHDIRREKLRFRRVIDRSVPDEMPDGLGW